MKLFDKKSLILLISVVSINLLCIISVSYAYFTANIKGNDTAKEMKVKAGSMEITYTDSNEVNLNNAIPGDSVTKTFKVENTGSLKTKYNIKIDVETNAFEDRGDLEVSLSRDGMDTINNVVPEAGEENGYILINQDIYPENDEEHPNDYLHSYTLKVTFKNDLEDPDQNDNANKEVKFKISVDSEDNVSLYEYVAPPKSLLEICHSNDSLNECLAKGEKLVNVHADDPDNNIRYDGKNPRNYVWFNCDDYAKVTDVATAAQQNCEKWRIIGLFKDIDIVDGENTTKQDLVKIIRADSLPIYHVWDNKPKGTGSSESDVGSNDWTDSRLMMFLNSGYENHELNDKDVTGSLYWNHGIGKCPGATSNTIVSTGTTMDCDFSTTGLKDGATKNMIESVKWKLGGLSEISSAESYYQNKTASTWYEYERSTEVYNNKRQTEWIGKIGLMYPSDYAYAAGGGNTYNRTSCLASNLYSWQNLEYKEDCAENDWLWDSSKIQWTLTPVSSASSYIFVVSSTGPVSINHGADRTHGVRPTLYLKSNVQIIDGKGTNEEPYRINVL